MRTIPDHELSKKMAEGAKKGNNLSASVSLYRGIEVEVA